MGGVIQAIASPAGLLSKLFGGKKQEALPQPTAITPPPTPTAKVEPLAQPKDSEQQQTEQAKQRLASERERARRQRKGRAETVVAGGTLGSQDISVTAKRLLGS